MKITFFGAAKQVTGSMFMLTFNDGYRVLIDCGTNLSKNSKNIEENNPFGVFPFDASLINLVVLTHAHIDHSGQIPNLYRFGFEGQVLCTAPTLELTDILLQDAASLNQRRLKSLHKKKISTKKNRAIAGEDLYLQRQVHEAMENFVAIQFGKKFRFNDNANVTFYPAGHLLGAAHVVFEITEDGETKTIGFSGDIGRSNYPLLVDPVQIPEVDYLVMETTYGNRAHKTKENSLDVLEKVIKEACVDKPGRMVIPAFSIGRTQALLYAIHQLVVQGRIPPLPLFTDSPLGRKSNQIYEKYVRFMNEEAIEFNRDEGGLFDFENLYYLASEKSSKEVANHTEPCIIISSSGMIQGGRVERHVAQNIGNPYATILLIGYSVEGTLGHDLLVGNREELTIFGKKEPIRADIKSIDVFSGHGDYNDLITFVEHQDSTKLKNIFLVHGEESTMSDFKQSLHNKGYGNVTIPSFKDSFEL